jgi:CDP-glycerol glycerophosphotransferase (TagB/SpsB family)
MSENSVLFWKARAGYWMGLWFRVASAWALLILACTLLGHWTGQIVNFVGNTEYIPLAPWRISWMPEQSNYLTIFGFLTSIILIAVVNLRVIRLLPLPLWIANLPIYWLSAFMPKKSNRWLFSARQGSAFAENCKYMYLHVSKHHPEVDAIWITKDREIYQTLKEQGLKSCMAYSLKGYWYSMTAGVIFLSHKKMWRPDGNGFAIAGNTLILQLWHGSPIKRLGNSVELRSDSIVSRMIGRAIITLFPFIPKRVSCHRMLASCETVARHLQESFCLEDSEMLISGYPKNDGWLRRVGAAEKRERRRAVYMPTFRSRDWRLFVDYNFDLDRLNEVCKKKNIDFYIKLHPYSLERIAPIMKHMEGYSNIKYCTVADIYEILDQFDILITDYSSISFDYLLFDRPIIFAPFDHDSYMTEERGFLEDYSSLTPGPHARNWPELEDLLDNPLTEYAEARQALNDKCNLYQGSDSSEQLVKWTRKLLDEGTGKTKPKHHLLY